LRGASSARADIRTHDDCQRRWLPGGFDATFGKGQDEPIQADPEADGRGGPSAQELDEAVVPAAAAERLLLPFSTEEVELEGRASVVVQAPDQPRLDPVRDPDRVEVPANRVEMLAAGGAQSLRDPRGRGIELRHRRVLRVEQPEGIPLEALAFKRREPVLVTPVPGGQLGEVGRPARAVPDRVQEHLDAFEAGLSVEARSELDDLGVDRGTRIADRLDVELRELPIAPGLGPVVPEHRAGQRELHRLRPRLHAVLDIRTDNPGGRLRPEGPGLALLLPGRDPEELLLDDVRDLADAPLEDGDLLEERRLERAVAVAGGEVCTKALEARERGAFGWQQVAGPARDTEGRHRGEV
jgi:hypothetical protein